MRGGVARWKRGIGNQGVNAAVDYALKGGCDAHLETSDFSTGVEAAAGYSGSQRIHRFVVEEGQISVDALDAEQLKIWVEGKDPETGSIRGVERPTPDADLLFDPTINSPKSFSIAAMIDADIADAYERLQDRTRNRIITLWQHELNARRGHAGVRREELSRIEVVELKHERSRSLDPHKHRHLWLNAKVRGRDGKWTNVDSRVMLKFQNVINAEGELGARTDPEWVAALAAKGYTLDSNGEIAELTHLVRPLSRRSNQIEANRAVKLAEWKNAHPGQEPTPQDLAAIDRWAWAEGRPRKPHDFDEDNWVATVRGELAELDPTLMRSLAKREAVPVSVVSVEHVDRPLLARVAVADADRRSVANGGRFSMFDIRAGVLRAVAASGVVGDRTKIEPLIAEVTANVVAKHCAALLSDAAPHHIKAFMAATTVATKQEYVAILDRIRQKGVAVPGDTITAIARQVLNQGKTIGAGQREAAAAIAGTDRIVTVTGPAGTGKTSMLKIAAKALRNQGRKCVVLAPTKKAAGVAGREIGFAGSSIHRLLIDHGWQFGVDEAGVPTVRQLKVNERYRGEDGRRYSYKGPQKFALTKGDRVVVDEAGMLDLQIARALAITLEQTGAGIAMVGDPKQVRPVGHSGAMSIAVSKADARAELETVHRFRKADDPTQVDDEYASLTLKIRDPETIEIARQVVQELLDRGQIVSAANTAAANDYIVGRYFDITAQIGRGGKRKTVAIVTSTNPEAQTINEAIQAGRIARGDLDTSRQGIGQNDQVLFVGDVVQTRKNDSITQVENREIWSIRKIRRNGDLHLVSTERPGERRTVAGTYARKHVHLAYASTVHGIQGETTDASLVGPGVDAAGFYVGVTRGTTINEIITLNQSNAVIVTELAETLMRARHETTLDDAARAARAELGRAAQPQPRQAPEAIAAWNNTKHRPFGDIPNIKEYLDRLNRELSPIHKKLAAVTDAETLNEAVHRIAVARNANAESRFHGTEATAQQIKTNNDLKEAATALAKSTAARVKLAQEHKILAEKVVTAYREHELRQRMPEEIHKYEDQQRRGLSASTNPSSTGPVVTPQIERTGQYMK